MAIRSLLRAPLLSLGVTATLALGVGALTANFCVLDAALLREPPFDDASRIAVLKLLRHPRGEPSRLEDWSFDRVRLLQQLQHSFEQVSAFTNPTFTVSGEGDVELVRGEVVSASYFPLLGIRAALGRTFNEGDDDPGNPIPIALVSRSLWERRWSSDPTLLGRAIRVNGVMLTVVGVLPDQFHGLSQRADLWVPTVMAPRLTYADYLKTNQNFIRVVGRLRDGIALDDARTELAVLGATINRAAPSDPRDPGERVSATAISLNEARVDPIVRRSLPVLMGAVGMLFLLACANVTNLLLGYAATRRHESAVRIALGSSFGRLFRHLLSEHLTLVAPGALLGVLLAWWASAFMSGPTTTWSTRGAYASIAPFDRPEFGPRELAFGLTIAVATALAAAVVSALAALRVDIHSEMKAGARSITGSSIRLLHPTPRGVIVAVEAMLAMLLVVSAGLLIDSFRRIRGMDLGVDTSNVLTFWVVPFEAHVPPGTAPSYISRLLAAVSSVPDVRSASVDGGAPMSGTARAPLFVLGRPLPPPWEAPTVLRHYVAPDHFRTLGIPLRRGRVFGLGDVAGSPRVTVISEGAARRFWPNEDPLGKRVWFGGASGFNTPDSSAEIIGVVGDVMYEPLDRLPNRASFYTPYSQFTYASRMVFLKTVHSPLAVIPDVRRALRGVDPDVAMRDIRTLEDIVYGSHALHRSGAILFGAFGVAALLLAASGIFAVLAHAVAVRTREFGVRIALGAEAANIMSLVMREGLAYPSIGLFVGVVASLAVTRVFRAALYEVSPLEPSVFAATVLLLLVSAVTACAVPAWRATRADPIQAMRAE